MAQKSKKTNPILVEFGANLAKLIREKGYRSRDAFLKKTDLEVYKADLHYLIKGDRDPHLTTMSKIAEALGVPLWELMPGYREAKKKG